MREAHNPILPVMAACAGVAALSLMDALMKGAALAVGVFSATWLRAVMGVALIAPFWLARGGRWPKLPVLRMHLLRGLVSTLMALTFFYALTKLPIAEAIAISFVAPLIALYLARLLLGETVRREAIFASILGFVGTLVIVWGRLSRSTIDADLVLGLIAIVASALLYAYNFIVIRRQSQMAGPAEIATFHSGISAVLLALAAPWLFAVPDPAIGSLIAGAAALTVIGALAIAWAYAKEEAQRLVPLEYSGFLWASLFGWLFFRETVTATTIAGTGLILVGCWLGIRPVRPVGPG